MSREFEYFESSQVSKLVDLLLQVATDLHVTTTRLRALEMQLVRDGVLQEEQLDLFKPTENERKVLTQERESFQGRLLRIITEGGPAEHPLREQWEAELARKRQ